MDHSITFFNNKSVVTKVIINGIEQILRGHLSVRNSKITLSRPEILYLSEEGWNFNRHPKLKKKSGCLELEERYIMEIGEYLSDDKFDPRMFTEKIPEKSFYEMT